MSEPRHQPGADLIAKSGYPEVRAIIDMEASHLIPPNRDTLLQAAFPSLSGAARIDIVPASGPFKDFRGNVIIAMNGDRAPFATGGLKLAETVGYKVVRVDPDMHQTREFIRNTVNNPRSRIPGHSVSLLERPIDVKFGPDGSLYVLDFGELEMREGREHVTPGTGQIFRLVPVSETPTSPANKAGIEER